MLLILKVCISYINADIHVENLKTVVLSYGTDARNHIPTQTRTPTLYRGSITLQ